MRRGAIRRTLRISGRKAMKEFDPGRGKNAKKNREKSWKIVKKM